MYLPWQNKDGESVRLVHTHTHDVSTTNGSSYHCLPTSCTFLVYFEATFLTYNFCVYKYVPCVLIRVFTFSGVRARIFMKDLLPSGLLRLLVVVSFFEFYD